MHRAGWSLGERGNANSSWMVEAANGENATLAHGATQAEAWHEAVEQARALGVLGRSQPRWGAGPAGRR